MTMKKAVLETMHHFIPRLMYVGSVALASALVCVPALAESLDEGSFSVEKIITGKSVCRNETKENAVCGIDRWTMYVHGNGDRYLHVMSDNVASNSARHVVISISRENRVREAYASASRAGESIGSSYVVLRNDRAYVVADNSHFSSDETDVRMEVLDQPSPAVSIGTGPASADGVHFANFGAAKQDVHESSIYWIGGSYGDMFGAFFDSSNELIGEEPFILADGSTVTATKYRMKTGSEIWLLQPYDVLLKIRLAFGAVKGQVYKTTELEIVNQMP